jgi:hypothetical protein
VLGRGTERRTRQPDLLEMLEDVSANQDEGCKILQVHSCIVSCLKRIQA